MPFYYTLSLESLDGLGENFIINITAQRSGEVIYMAIEEVLPSRSLWNVTILPNGCEGYILVDNIELSM